MGPSSVSGVELEDRLTLNEAEGIDLDLRLAGIASRGAALIIDLVFQLLLLIVVTAVGAELGDLGLAFAAVGSFLLLFAYPTLAEAFAGGRTVGKAIMRVHVIGVDGRPVTFVQAAVRNVVRFVDALPGAYLVGIVAVLFTAKAQRLGDLAAGTLVVHSRPRPGNATPWAPSVDVAFGDVDMAGWDLSAVSAEELAAVRSFLGRRAELAPAARLEIGGTLAARLRPRVAGVPTDGGDEAFLERVAAAQAAR